MARHTYYPPPPPSRLGRCELTYRFPRTWAEAAARFPCAGDEAVAVRRYRTPLHKRMIWALADYGAVVLVALALAYLFAHGWSLPQ